MGSLKACTLCAIVMAASAAIGSSATPVVLSQPTQPLVAHVLPR